MADRVDVREQIVYHFPRAKTDGFGTRFSEEIRAHNFHLEPTCRRKLKSYSGANLIEPTIIIVRFGERIARGEIQRALTTYKTRVMTSIKVVLIHRVRIIS
jgi:hypothetical protein